MKDTAAVIERAAGGAWILRWLLVAVLALIVILLALLITGYELTIGSSKFRIGRPAPAEQTAVTRAEFADELKNCIRYDHQVNLINASSPKEALVGFGSDTVKLKIYNPKDAQQGWILKQSQ